MPTNIAGPQPQVMKVTESPSVIADLVLRARRENNPWIIVTREDGTELGVLHEKITMLYGLSE